MQYHAHIRSILTPALAACALAGASHAQLATQIPYGTAQGYVTGWAMGITAVDTLSSSQTGAIRIRAPAVKDGKPTAWTATDFGAATGAHPDYSLAALAANWGLTFPVTSLPVNLFGGISTGGDVTPKVDAGGTLQPHPRLWFALNFTLSPGATGTNGSLINSRYDALPGHDVSGDVYSYYPFIGSTLPSVYADTVRVEHTQVQLGFDSSSARVTNIDYGIGMISIDPNANLGTLMPVRNCFYFTLTKQALTSVPAGHSWPVWVAGHTVNPSTIYRMEWNGTSWAAPVIAFDHSVLFPEVGAGLNLHDPEIDAISVYQTDVAPGHDRVVFSLTLNSNVPGQTMYDQLLVFQRATGNSSTPSTYAPDCPTTALMVLPPAAATPVPVTEHVGLNRVSPDNILSTCGFDPTRGEPTLPMNAVVGIAVDDSAPGNQLGLSGIRTRLPDPSSPTNVIDTMHYQVTGLDTQGMDSGAVALFLLTGTSLALIRTEVVDPRDLLRNSWCTSMTPAIANPGDPSVKLVAMFLPFDSATLALGTPRTSWILEIVHN